jgi:hypothetical protein
MRDRSIPVYGHPYLQFETYVKLGFRNVESSEASPRSPSPITCVILQSSHLVQRSRTFAAAPKVAGTRGGRQRRDGWGAGEGETVHVKKTEARQVGARTGRHARGRRGKLHPEYPLCSCAGAGGRVCWYPHWHRTGFTPCTSHLLYSSTKSPCRTAMSHCSPSDSQGLRMVRGTIMPSASRPFKLILG